MATTGSPLAPAVEFRRWNLYVFLSTVLIIAESKGWNVHVRLPYIELPPEAGTAVINVAWLFLCFSGVKMVTEWLDAENNKQWGMLIQLFAGCILFIAGQIFFIVSIINWPYYIDELFDLDTILISAILLLGCAAGLFLGSLLELLPLIRSREERERTSLPRFPVAVSSVAMTAGVLFFFGVAAAFGLSFFISGPISSHWWEMYLGTTILISLPGATSFLLGKNKLAKIKAIFDMHDSMYMVYGRMRGSSKVRRDPLYIAAERGDEGAVRELVGSGHDPDQVGEMGWTALLITVAQGHDDIARYLLDCEANPNVGNFLGRTPLMFASRNGNVGMVRTLLEFGADQNFTSLPIRPPRNHPLMAAAEMGHKEIVELLIEAGADLYIKDTDGLTAEDYARSAGHGDIATFLRKKRRMHENK